MPNAKRILHGKAVPALRGSDELPVRGVIHNLRNIRQDPDASTELAEAAEDLALELRVGTAVPR